MENIRKAVELKKALDNLRPLSKENEERIMQKFRLDWSYHSNNLEGNSLTYGETKALLYFGITANGKPLKDHLETHGHNDAINWVLDIVKEKRPITENFIRELHELILVKSYKKDAISKDGVKSFRQIEIGKYKSTPNHVKTVTGEIFYFASPEETPGKMMDLINWFREEEEKQAVDPIILASLFHYKFIRIHPFDDGNGRIARILMNFILMKYGYPPVVIKTEDKQNYFSALREADNENISAFIDYMASNLVHALELMIIGANGGTIEEEADIDKEMALLNAQLQHIGKDIKTFKSGNVVKAIANDSLARLHYSFYNKVNDFSKQYRAHKYSIKVNSNSIHLLNNIWDIKKLKISNLTNSIVFNFEFSGIKNEKINVDAFVHVISISFFEKYYKIDVPHGLKLENDYDTQLQNTEIIDIVNSSMRTHIQFLKNEIMKIDQK